LPQAIERRRELASLYDKALEDIAMVSRPPAPTTEGPYFDVYQNYVIQAERRDDLAAFLTESGVETLISLPIPNHKQPALGLDHFHLPVTEEISRTQISLPLTTELEDGQIEYVADTIRRFYGA
ncbi:MAG TPA: DegT/DnrJ/EryC1/StrS family aminotransferase, partial [Actinomycetota bacterium]|nr:DegT/DnrJ/EryC1/StrS family aminotransferase [Actinomycetota bacterium]